MVRRLFEELGLLWRGLAGLDRQTAVVLTLAAVLGMWKYTFGSRVFFERHLAEGLGVDGRGLWSYLYLFAGQGVTGFVLTVVVLIAIFRKSPSEIGLGLGDWKLAFSVLGLYVPIVLAGCWVLSAQGSFQRKYPLYHDVSGDWGLFVVYEILFLFYWVGWEYLWRGFTLFGTAHSLGRWAIFVQMLPFAALHAQKPTAEAYLSVLGGLVLGAVVWRCRSFWVAVPIHSVQMMAMDLCCTLRVRSGVTEGIGIEALRDAFSM